MKDYDQSAESKLASEETETLHIALEPRIAFDAALAAEALEAAESIKDQIEPPSKDPAGYDTAALFEALGDAPEGANQIVFIDAGVADPSGLLNQSPEGAEVVFLDPTSDGVDQMAQVLAGRSDLEAVHIISHGEPGALNLGASTLTKQSISGSHSDALATIGGALGDNADIFIYGCDFGADATAVEALARATGADIAASDDVTGASDLGGDWDLEVASGEIEAASIEALDWHGALADSSISGADLETAAGGSSSFSVSGPDGNTFTVSRDDGGTITGEAGGAGLGRDFGAAADANPGASESYTITPTQPLDEIVLSFGFLNNNIDGEDQLSGFTARDETGNIIPDAVFTLDDTSASGGGGLFLVGQTFSTGPVVATAPNGSVEINGLTGSADVGGSASGTLSITSATTPIATVEFDRETARGGRVFTGGFGVILDGLDYTTNAGPDFDGDGVPDFEDLDDDNDGILDSVEDAQTFSTADVQTLALTDGGYKSDTWSAPGSFRDQINYSPTNPNIGMVGFANQPRSGFGELLEPISLQNGDPLSTTLDVPTTITAPSDNFALPDAGGTGAVTAWQVIRGYIYVPDTITSDFEVTLDAFNNFATHHLYLGTTDTDTYDAASNTFGDGTVNEVTTNFSDLKLVSDVGVGAPGPVGDGAVGQGNGSAAGDPETIRIDQSQAGKFVAFAVLTTDNGIRGQVALQTSVPTYLLCDLPIPDSDGDGFRNSQDIDADNDGITDNVEAQSTADYIAPSGQGAAAIDLNDDGIDDNYGSGLTPVDTDGDGTADYLDSDSDNDGISDARERGDGGPLAATGDDADGDGLLDIFEGSDATDGVDVNDENVAGDNGGSDGDYARFTLGDTPNGTNANEAVATRTLNDAVAGVIDLDYRDADTDNDGVPDADDIDDDNDGILDTVERQQAITAARETNQALQSTGILANSDGITNQSPGSVAIYGLEDPANPGVLIGYVRATLVDLSNPASRLDWRFSGVGGGAPSAPLRTGDSDNGTEETATILFELFGTGDTPASLLTGVPGTDPLSLNFNTTIGDIDGPPAGRTEFVEASLDTLSAYTVQGSGGTLTTSELDGGARITGTANNPSDRARFEYVETQNFVLTLGSTRSNAGYSFDLSGTATFSDPVTTIVGVDSDGDGFNDDRDIDKDNDGITDNVEAQTTAGYIEPTGSDSDGDGLDDAYDATPTTGAAGSAGLTEVDTESDGVVDTLDDDSDGDGKLDVAERGDGAPTSVPSTPVDSDGDGLIDSFEGADVNDRFDVNDENLDPADTNFNLSGDGALNADGSNAAPLARDLDYRDAVELEDDIASTDAGVPITANVLGNDDITASLDPTDPGSGVTLSLLDGAGNPVPGPLTVPGVGTYQVVDVGGIPQIEFTPVATFSGTAPPVAYGIISGGNVLEQANLTVLVNAIPDPVDDALVGSEDTDLPLDILSNDDVGNGVATVTIDTIPPAAEGVVQYTDAGGTRIDITPGTSLTPAEAATLVFVPAPNFFSSVTPFGYTITDIDGDTGSAAVNITIDGDPEAQPDTVTVTEDTPTPFDITANDDGGEPPFTFALDSVPPATQGTLTYADDDTGATITIDPSSPPAGLSQSEASSLIFTPTPNYTGPVDPIAYTVTDDDGDTSSSTATLTIDAVPDPVADVLTTSEDAPLDLPILDNDDTGDGLSALIVDNVPPASQGTLTYVDGSGATQNVAAGTPLTPAEAATLQFTPAAGFSGPVATINYTVEDSDGDRGSATLNITVDGIPDVSPDAVTTQENTPIALDPLANDTDFGDGFDAAIIDTVPAASQGVLTYVDDATGTRVTASAGAELSEAEMGTLGFAPATGFSGEVTPISYTVRDTDGDIATTQIQIEVAASVDAVDDNLTVPQDTPLAVAPIANDDPGGPDAVVAVTSLPPVEQGTLTYVDDATGTFVTLNPTDTLSTAEFATIVFTPAAGFVGPVDPINYTISDPLGNTDSAAIDILVDGIPDAGDDVVAGEEDTPVAVLILGNDRLGDGPTSVRIDNVPPVGEGALTYVNDSGVTQTVAPGDVLSEAEAGLLTFEPAPDFSGPVTAFSYTITDSDGDTSSADVNITINAAPDLVPDVVTLTEDTEGPLPILTNDDLGDGVDTVTINTLPPAAQGVLRYVDAGGTVRPVVAGTPLSAAEIATLSFDPAPNFFGPVDRFTYTVADTDGDTATTTVDVVVDGIPEPAPDVFATDEDAPVVIDLTANDDRGDGPATVTLDSVPPTSQGILTYTDADTGATVTVNPATPPAGLDPVEISTLTFTPAPDYDGPVDPIIYTITDADGDSASSSATVSINALPDPVADTFVTDEDTPLPIDLVGNDDTGNGLGTLTIDALPAPALGTLTYTNASGSVVPVVAGTPLSPSEAATIVFSPAADVSGVVPPLSYTITDLSGDSASSTFSITIDAVPDPIDDTLTTPEDTPVAINVLDDNGAGADDPGSSLGSVRIDTIPPAGQGKLGYTDGTGNPQVVTPGTVLTPTEAATLTFTPVTGYIGPVASVDYTLIDIDGDEGSAELNITVDGLPDLAPDVFVGGPNETLDTNFIANDPDFGDGLREVTIPTAPNPTQGVLTYTDDASGATVTVSDGETLSAAEMATLQFNPEDTFFGAVDPITYTVTDIDGDAESATANIFINAATDAEPDDILTKEDVPVDLNLLDNDEIADPDSTITIGAVVPDPTTQGVLTYIDDLTGSPVQIAAGDTLSVTELATISFDPADGFTGTATPFDYTITASPGGGGASDTATVTIVVDPVPEAMNDSYATDEDTAISIPVNANDDNGTGFAELEFTSLPAPGEGVVEYQLGGSGAFVAVPVNTALTAAEVATLRFVPAADFSGPVTTFQYILTDAADSNGVQDTDTATVDIAIDAVPDPLDDAVTVTEDTPAPIDILGNDDPGDGVASVTFSNVPTPATGTLTYVDGTGNPQSVLPGTPLSPTEAASLVFTPAENFNGPIPPLTYTLEDTNGDTGTATVTLTMDDVPDADPDSYLTDEDTPIAIDPTVNDLDAGDPGSSVVLTAPPATQGILSYETTPGNPATRIDLPPGAASPSLSQQQFATLIFTPTTDFAGPVDPVPYTVTDADGDTVTTTINLEVDAVPDPVDDTFDVPEDAPLTFSVIDNDDQGDGPASVTIAAIPPASAGILTYLSDAGIVTPVTPGTPISVTEAGLLTFTPAPDFDGVIPPLPHTLTDANGDTGAATLTLNMNPRPDLSDDVVEVTEDSPINFNPLANDQDFGDGPSTVALTGPPADQGTLSYETTPGNPATRIDIPAGSAVTGLTPAEAATLRFTPTPDYDGPIDPISYTVTDATGDPASATINFNLNALPDPVDDVEEVETGIPFDLDVVANDDTGDGLESLRFDTLPPPSQGVLTVLEGGVRRPVAINETLTPDLAATVQFDPNDAYLGPVDLFSYIVRDTSGDEAGAQVSLTVDPAPLPASDVSTLTPNGSPVTIDVVANDEDNPRGDNVDPTSVQIFGTSNPGDPLTVPGQGTWTVNPTSGALTFTPDPGFVGDPDPVLYTIADDDGRRSTPVAVLADYEPVATDDIAGNLPPGPYTIDVLANDTDGDPIVPGTVQIVGTSGPGQPLVVPGEGTWSIDPFVGTITFTPEPGFTLDPTPIQYVGQDDQGNPTDPANVTLDYAPVAQPDVISGVLPGEVAIVNVLANDTLGDTVDPTSFQFDGTANPGDPLIVPGEGVYTYDPTTGEVTFTPEEGFAGLVTPIGYTVADDEGNRTASTPITIEALFPVTDLDDGDLIDPFEEDIDQPMLVVDPIIHDTATSLIGLNANEILFGDFPILTAINGLFSLGGIGILPTEDVPIFGGLKAPYPITMAVEDVDPGTLLGLYGGLAEPILESLHNKSHPHASYYFLLGESGMIGIETAISADVASLRINATSDGMTGAEIHVDPVDRAEANVRAEGGLLVIDGLAVDTALSLDVVTGAGEQLEGFLSISPSNQTIELRLTQASYQGFSGIIASIAGAEQAEIATLKAALS